MDELAMKYEGVANTSETIINLTNAVRDSAVELKGVAEKCVREGIQIDWARELLEKLNYFIENTMEDGMSLMIKQASKLDEASGAVQAYEQEKK